MKITYSVIFLLIFHFSFSQEFQIQGTVKDGQGLGLPGVNVIVKNTRNGTSTDFNGNYKLDKVKSGDVVVYSYLGFITREVVVGTNKNLDVILEEDTASLDEIVIIGYGTQAKKEVTGAVSVLAAETIQEVKAPRIEQALQGQVAGVNVTSVSGSPGSPSTITIRGISTNGDNRPLILVDGNVIEDLSVLNPTDIESINILKDGTAGIYGVRAANGVIIVTTKSGKKSQKLKYTLDTYAGFQTTSRRISVLNATEYGAIINEAFVAGGGSPPYPNLAALGKGTDWQDEVFQTAAISDVNFGVSGGTENSTYAGGLSYLTQDGIVGGSKANFERITARFNYGLDFLKNFKLSSSGIYTNTNRKSLLESTIGSVLFNALNMAPTLPVYDENGDFTLAEGLGNEVINPVAQIANTFNNVKVDKIAGTIGLNYKFLDGFSAESRFQFNYAEVEGRFFSPEVFYGSGKVFNVDRSVVTQNKDFFKDYTWDNFLKYEKLIGDDHDVKVLLGTSAFKTSSTLSGSTGFDIIDNSYDNANIALASDVVDNFPNGGNYSESRLLSYFARFQYDFRDKYLLSLLGRRDGSASFGPKNKFGYFYSASAGWVLSDEEFMRGSSVFSFLKLRGSYGVLGNDRIPAFQFVSLLNGEGVYVFDNDLSFGTAIGAISNPEVRWERQKNFDVGFDTRLFKNKFDITFDYYKKTTEDLLVAIPVSGTLGASAPGSSPPIVNAGVVENQGIEFRIAFEHKITSDFKVNLAYNLTTVNNNVVSVNDENTFIAGGSFGVGQDPPARMEAGKPIGYFYGLQTDGIFQNQQEIEDYNFTRINTETGLEEVVLVQPNAAPGDFRFVDINNDGVIDSDDRTDIGNPIPDMTMGLNLGFTYKNFDFISYSFASLGNDIVRNYERDQQLVNRRNGYLDRWTGEGSTNSFPRVTTGATTNTLFSDFYVEDGSFLRIQNVQLGYTISDRFMKPMGLDQFRVYVSVNNLYTFTKYTGYDPSASTGAPIGGGIDQGFYPVPRTYLFGVNLKF